MLTEAADFREECSVLNTLLINLEDSDWSLPTQFKGWTTNDIVGHLHLFDVAARITLESSERFREFIGQIMAGREEGRTLAEYTSHWLEGCQGEALRERWYRYAMDLAEAYAQQEPSHRVAWGGPDMSVRSCISARQMETWSHGQAVFDLKGVDRVESDRLRNIAVIGVNTFAWSFANRKLPVPAKRPSLHLTSPSGQVWEWSQGAETSITGPALDFCQVVTQTRNIADTSLQVIGDDAHQWMAIAQCFAGPPVDPPAPGTRFPQGHSSKLP